MLHLVLRGRVAPNVLAALPNLTRPFQKDTGIHYAFVLRQDHDISVGATFCVTGVGANGHEVTERYRLVAVSQQFDFPFDEIPHGWNTVCAFQLLGPDFGLLASLPLAEEWYEQRATELVLIAES